MNVALEFFSFGLLNSFFTKIVSNYLKIFNIKKIKYSFKNKYLLKIRIFSKKILNFLN